MFGFGLLLVIPVMVVLYGLAALAMVSYASYRKNSIVPGVELVRDYHGSRFFTRLSDEQKTARDMWECVQVFSFLWPFEIIAGAAVGLWYAFKRGVLHLAKLSGDRAKQTTDRVIVRKIEDAREEALAIDDDEHRQQALASLDHLMSQHGGTRTLSLTGSK